MKSKIFLNRAKRLQDLCKMWDVDGFLIEDPIDVFYLTGLQFSLATLIVHSQETALFVDGRYFAFAKNNSPFPTYLLSTLPSQAQGSLGFDTSYTTVKRWEELKLIYPKTKKTEKPVQQIRAIKDPEEIQLLEKSATLLWKGFQHIQTKIKIGVTEKELAYAFENFCKQNGGEKLGFDPIIAFGENTAYPHHKAGNTPLQNNTTILCDLGVVVDHYHSDMTRTFFLGTPPAPLEALKKVVQQASTAALKLCKPGTPVSLLSETAHSIIQKAGFEKLIAHSLGHGIGLEIHEFPRLSEKENPNTLLAEGMVITIEPGLYLPKTGGFRHEDTIVITNSGYKNFYSNLDTNQNTP
jgi:Xaa-Pro aminopeptidase